MLPLQKVFSDKASRILREMLKDPDREWVVRDFVDDLGLGRGWVASVMSGLRQSGFLSGPARGRNAGSRLRNPEGLVQSWVQRYTMDLNKVQVFYTPEPNLLPRIRRFFDAREAGQAYALTLHSGANLITNHVRDPNLYLYLDPAASTGLIDRLRTALELKELKRGGNVYLYRPFYKNSLFRDVRRIRGLPVVSNLQLYLDLFHFPARGREHAEHLLRTLKEKGLPLA